MSQNPATYKPAVITVGDELIFGEKNNANQCWMSSRLWHRGHPAELSMVLPDNEITISLWIRQLVEQTYFPILISGGIGGTHDDCTRQGIAAGLNVDLVQHKVCYEHLVKRAKERNFPITKQNQRMTYLPAGCELIANDTGMPGFSVSGVFSFPGFPTMMQPMLDSVLDTVMPDSSKKWYIKEAEFKLSEGVIGPLIEGFQKKNSSVIIGVYPDSTHNGIVRVQYRAPIDDQKTHVLFNELLSTLSEFPD